MPDRVLFIRLSALGDIVVTLPALALLREARPDLLVDWLVEDRFASFLAEVEGINRVLVYPRRAFAQPGWRTPFLAIRHWSALRSGDWSVAIDFQGNLKSGMQLRLAQARTKVGLDRDAAKEGAHRFANARVPVPPGCHRVERALRLLEPLGIPARDAFADGAIHERFRPNFRSDPAAVAAVGKVLGSDARPIVMLHPGTSAFAAFKRWPSARFGELALELAADGARRIVVTHGPGEEPLAEAVANAAGRGVEIVRPDYGFAGLIALFRRADLVVAADSGPLLLASALGRPTVALFGPKDPTLYSPPFGRTRVVRRNVPCSPCSLRDCGDPICMTGLIAEPVARAINDLIGTQRV